MEITKQLKQVSKDLSDIVDIIESTHLVGEQLRPGIYLVDELLNAIYQVNDAIEGLKDMKGKI